MFDVNVIRKDTKMNLYEDLASFAEGLFYEEGDPIANMSNMASLLYHVLSDVNWAGFYLFKEEMLVLGPFHGKPACIRIEIGKGVCGRAAGEKATQLVKDVHQFEGHIACDATTNSEIVIPLIRDDQLIGVLDIDSPIKNRFDEEDQKALEKLADMLVKACDW